MKIDNFHFPIGIMATVSPNVTLSSSKNDNIAITPSPQLPLDIILPQICITILAACSIIGNFLVCFVFLRNKQLLRLASSIFIFSLAIIDILTGIIILATPSITYSNFKVPFNSVNGELYCSLIVSEYFLWSLGFTSCLIIATLSAERLCMVSAPSNYKAFFTPRKTIFYVFVALICGGILNGTSLFTDYFVRNVTDRVTCKFRQLPGGETLNQIVYFTLFLLRFVLPLVVMVSCYVAFMRKIKRSVSGISSAAKLKTNARNRMMIRRLTRMSFLISIAFCVCWMPNQVYFALYAQHLVPLDKPVHIITRILVVLNSAINPIIYATSNKYFYNELVYVIKLIFCLQHQNKQNFSISPSDRKT